MNCLESGQVENVVRVSLTTEGTDCVLLSSVSLVLYPWPWPLMGAGKMGNPVMLTDDGWLVDHQVAACPLGRRQAGPGSESHGKEAL